ncbi:universal stress protein [Mangrovibrevibacter kandeliae]|uniref:universal stress protein n=1 Tax=Mangrovibrevibacter kandeliae TaxID=2968473 RepID=UPI002118F788|nr:MULTISPECIES: universal stress protein [unclassified Aurantimonas]MCQ8783123.1 universal stress protein [Aurantimonas sp. CSK15Z-1]MCW4115688.1 universal stress protein [Aurantimonas sp. MSK8Z-1]
MNTILACIDGSIYGTSVCGHAAWAAQRLGAPVDVLHALGRREVPSTLYDFSGALEFGARETLLTELAELDAQKAKLAGERGRVMVEQAVKRLRASGVGEVHERLRHGDLSDAIAELDPQTRLVVIGKRGEAADFAKGHLGSNLERVIRTSRKPLLVASRAFRPVERFMVAFDGGRSSHAIIERLADSPLLAGLPCHLFMVGEAAGDPGERLRQAQQRLVGAGYQVSVGVGEGEPEAAIAERVERDGIGLLVMGAYGHSRIRHLIVGSTTTALIRATTVPVLVVR